METGRQVIYFNKIHSKYQHVSNELHLILAIDTNRGNGDGSF